VVDKNFSPVVDKVCSFEPDCNAFKAADVAGGYGENECRSFSATVVTTAKTNMMTAYTHFSVDKTNELE